MRSGRPLVLAASLVALASCKDATQVLVRFEAESMTVARADRIRVVIHGQDQSVRLDQVGVLQGAALQVSFPTVVPVSPIDRDASRIFHIEGELLDADDVIFSEARMITGFVENRKRELTLLFYDNCIDRFECSWEQTCQDGQCVDAYVPRPGEDAGVPGTGMCTETPCRLKAPQCGCADGLSCQGIAAPACLVPGPAGPGEACTPGECIGGLTCWLITPAPQGSCQRYCTSDEDCPTSFCLGDPLAQAGVCLPGCDPIAQLGCPAGESCAYANGTSYGGGPDRASTTCGVVGTDAEGAACSGSSCAPGHVCGSGTCFRLCRVGDASTCSSGQTCAAGVPRIFAAGVEYGACM